jgi:hypothetical protein
VQRQAAVTLAILACNDSSNQQAIAQAGAIPPLVQLLSSTQQRRGARESSSSVDAVMQ